MSYPFKGQDISIALDAQQSLAGATDPVILYEKPDGSTGNWTAVVDGENLTYLATDGEIDQSGTWIFQGRIDIGSERYYTTKAKQYFEKPIA